MNNEIKEMEYGKDRKIELLCEDKYKNYNYYVLNLGTHPTAYIEIPKEDKLYGKTYFTIYEMGCDIDVNGGLTYSSNELIGIKSENWFIGWDYAHFNDYYPDLNDGKKWTTEEIIDECKNAIDQIIEFESKEILEEEKKIPEKLNKYKESDDECCFENILKVYEGGEYEITEDISFIVDKINEIIDYLKSKGE